MARQPRSAQVVPGLAHHVVLRGNNRRRLFSYPRDRLEFLRLVARASSAHGVPLHAFSLLTNHTHLVVTPEATSALSAFVKAFAQEYAWRRNRALDRSGKLFEERFFCKPITSDDQLVRTIAYVDLNAVRAGMCRSPELHRWCSYRLHATGRDPLLPDGLWTPHPWWLGLGGDDATRGQNFRAIVAGISPQEEPANEPNRYVLAAEAASARAPIGDRRPDGSRVAEEVERYERSWPNRRRSGAISRG